VPDGRAANQPLRVTTLRPPIGALFPGARESFAMIGSLARFDAFSWTVLEAAATEPLIEIDGQPGFDADRFFQRLLAMREQDGHG